MQALNCCRRCSVPSCNRPRSPGTPLHGFPDPIYEPERFRTWVYWVGGDILTMDNLKIYKYRNVCHHHFERKYLLGKKRLSHTAVPTLNYLGTRTRKKDKETKRSAAVESVIVKPDTTQLVEDPLMVGCQEDCAMDIEVGTEVVVDNVSDHSDVEEVDMKSDEETVPGVVKDDDDRLSDSDDQSNDGFPGFPAFQPESRSSVIKLTAKLNTDKPTVKLTDNLPTAKLTTNLPTAEVTTSLPTDKRTTNLSTAKVTTSLPTDKRTTNLSTAKVTTSLPTDKRTTNLSTAKVTTSLPTAKRTTNLPTAKVTANLSTDKLTTDLLTDKLTTSLPTAQLTTNLRTANFTTDLPTAKLTTNPPTLKLATNHRTAKLSTNLPAAKLTTSLPKNTITTKLSITELLANLTKGAKHKTNSQTPKRIVIVPSAKLTTNQPTAKLNTNLATAKPSRKVLISNHNQMLAKFLGKTDIQPTEKSPTRGTVKPLDLLIQSEKDTFAKQGQFGHCRCCLTEGTHSSVDIFEELACLNIQLSPDPRVRALVCSDCSNFLQQARKFRDMAAASERTLLNSLPVLDQDSDTKTLISSSNVSWAEPTQDADTGLPEEAANQVPALVQEGHIQEDEDFDTAGEITISEEQTGQYIEERPFSQLSDYNGMDKAEDSEDPSNNISDYMMFTMNKARTNLSKLILDNLITLFENSTILPFVSPKGDVLDCLYCDGSFTNIDDLRAHVEEHVNENNSKREIIKLIPQLVIRADISSMKCRLCDEQFTKIDNLAQHLVKEHNKTYHDLVTDPPHNILCFNLGLKDFKCLTCEAIFPTFKKLRLHVNQHFGSFLCHLCGMKSLYPNVYFKHMQDHQKLKAENQHACGACSESFNSKRDLMFHTNRAHYHETFKVRGVKRRIKDEPVNVKPESPVSDRESVKIYECGFCNNGTIFTNSHSAYMHRIGHLNRARAGPYECEFCDYITSKKINLRGHLIAHYDFKRFTCEVCHKKFRRKSQLSDHMHTHFSLRFQCPLCDSTLSSKKHVKRHVKNKHPNVIVDFSD